MLYIVSTPIGNLQDLTYRAYNVLQSCDYVLCEDRRKAQVLLSHYNLKKPLVLFHEFCEKKQEDKIIIDLQNQKEIALISDAGTPLISDPGQSLVTRIIKEDLLFTVIPGASSIMAALVLSGFSAERFQFVGFLPKKKGEKEKKLKQLLFYRGTSIAFESPYRIQNTLEILDALSPNATVAIGRELTKKFEECLRDTPKNLYKHFSQKPPKGEMVLLIEGNQTELDTSLEEIIPLIQEETGLSKKESLRLAKRWYPKTKKG